MDVAKLPQGVSGLHFERRENRNNKDEPEQRKDAG
jgi:hypothetical protein